jgi:hypothetical protein
MIASLYSRLNDGKVAATSDNRGDFKRAQLRRDRYIEGG